MIFYKVFFIDFTKNVWEEESQFDFLFRSIFFFEKCQVDYRLLLLKRLGINSSDSENYVFTKNIFVYLYYLVFVRNVQFANTGEMVDLVQMFYSKDSKFTRKFLYIKYNLSSKNIHAALFVVPPYLPGRFS